MSNPLFFASLLLRAEFEYSVQSFPPRHPDNMSLTHQTALQDIDGLNSMTDRIVLDVVGWSRAKAPEHDERLQAFSRVICNVLSGHNLGRLFKFALRCWCDHAVHGPTG
jgi:hypothetical protein